MSEKKGDTPRVLRLRNMQYSDITFCLLTLNRTPWVKRSLLSIRDYCPTKHSIKILSQGQPSPQLIEFVTDLDENIELITSPVNLGCGGGRQLLSERVTSPFTMMLDDDMYLTDGAIVHALNAFQENKSIGAVSMPQYDLDGRIVSLGGTHMIIEDGVIRFQRPRLNFQDDLIEVEYVDAGAMLYRTEMRESFSWDPEMLDFEDEDKSLQILRDGKWKQAIVPKGRLIHDRSWLGRNPTYERKRLDGLAWRRAYRSFRAKWRLRLDLRSHLLYEVVYPTLTLTRCQRLMTALNRFIQMRKMNAICELSSS